jgi:2-iminobutanoate/2-iminopropanoate deaminase
MTANKKELCSPFAPLPAGPYSQGLMTGNRIYVAGQRPEVPEGSVPDGIEEQSRQVLRNVRAVLESAGAGMEHVVKVGVFLANLDDFAAFNTVYAEFFIPPYPVRTTIGCALRNNILVEVDAVAEV